MEYQWLAIYLSSPPPIVSLHLWLPKRVHCLPFCKLQAQQHRRQHTQVAREQPERGDLGVSSWLPSAKLETVIHTKVGTPGKQAVLMDPDRNGAAHSLKWYVRGSLPSYSQITKLLYLCDWTLDNRIRNPRELPYELALGKHTNFFLDVIRVRGGTGRGIWQRPSRRRMRELEPGVASLHDTYFGHAWVWEGSAFLRVTPKWTHCRCGARLHEDGRKHGHHGQSLAPAHKSTANRILSKTRQQQRFFFQCLQWLQPTDGE